jgi:hypothetical protein
MMLRSTVLRVEISLLSPHRSTVVLRRPNSAAFESPQFAWWSDAEGQ